MSSVIYWYPLELAPEDVDEETVPGDEFRAVAGGVPHHATLLSIKERQGKIVAYFRVNPEEASTTDWVFYVVPTGAEFNIHGVPFYDTISIDWLVFHIFCTMGR